MRRARSAKVLVFTALTSLAGHAAAQDDVDLARARATFQQAVELEQAGNCPAALNLFRQVGQVRMTPQVRFHIGLCEAQLGRLVAALGGLELALADADSVGQGFRSEVEENVKRLRARIPRLTLRRGSGAETATIELDGTALGENSIGVEVPLDPGPHSITARARGYKDFEKTITLTEGGLETLEVELEPAPLPPPSGPALGTENVARPSKFRLAPYIVGGAGAASLIASGVLFALRQSSKSELDDACEGRSCPDTEKSEYDRLKVYHYSSLVTLGVGVAALGTAATLFVLDRKAGEQEQGTVSVHPTLLPTVAAASVRVRF